MDTFVSHPSPLPNFDTLSTTVTDPILTLAHSFPTHPTSQPTSPSPLPNPTPTPAPNSLEPIILVDTSIATSTNTSTANSADSSALVLFTVSTNSHAMTTQSKNGVFKPKVKAYIAIQALVAKVDYIELEPPNFKTVVQYPRWSKAMDEEFEAL